MMVTHMFISRERTRIGWKRKMTPKDRKITNEIMDKMSDWFWGRLMDDDCVCPNEDNVDPKCPNKRCIKLR